MRTKYPTTFIYALIDPCTNECRYVGKATDITLRHSQHVDWCWDEITYKNSWIRNLVRRGYTPEIIILDEVPEHCWQEAEIFWIAYMKSLGARLTNMTLGGDGGKPTPESCLKMSITFKEVWARPGYKEKLQEAQKLGWESSTAKNNASKAQTKRFENEVERIKQTTHMMDYWDSRRTSGNMKHSEEHAASIKAALNVPGAAEERGRRISAAKNNPESHARASASQTQRWINYRLNKLQEA